MPERLPPKPATAAGQFDLFGKRAGGPRVYSVSELTRELKAILEGRFPSVLVKGEVSNVRAPSSGHLYFTLKDADACLDAVLFRTEARRLRFSVHNGLSLVARGRLAVYEPQGRYQLVCDTIEPLGAGALQVAFEQLKERLQKEGLFEAARKRKLPFLPRRIALVTSPSGAVVHDFLRVLHRRYPNLAVLIVPARVQGDGAAQEIARGIVRAAKQPRVDVVVVARGGGSLEDLWAFNEEVVARALCGCPVPTVSAVGHETDVTIADFCADVRAPTPTAAAELIARVKDELLADLAQRKARLGRAMRAQLERKRGQGDKLRARVADPRRLIGDRKLRLDRARQRLEDLLNALLAARQQMLRALRDRLQAQHPRERLHRLEREVARLQQKLASLAGRTVAARRHRYEGLTARLDALSPLKVLARGYAVAFDARGHALLQASQVRPGERVRVRLHEGELSAHVEETKKGGGED
jgi:exodeoxyribonuclease VII large subunit